MHTALIGTVPETGVLSTNFVVPDSRHVFILIGYPRTNPADIHGELKLTNELGADTFPISKAAPDANWLASMGLNAVLVTQKSLAEKSFAGRYAPGSKCHIIVQLTNAPKSSAVYLGFLK